jgi:Na+/proline symporter
VILSIGLKSMVSITFVTVAFGCVIGLVVVASWLIRQIHPRTLIGGMVSGFSGTLLLAIIEPVIETLVLKAILFTFLGFFVRSLLNLLSRKRKREYS